MISADIIRLKERIKVLEKNRQTLENELDETIEYADYIAVNGETDGAEELPALEIEIERMRLKIDMIDIAIEEVEDMIEEIKDLMGMEE